MKPPPIRLAFGALFWRVFLGLFLISEFVIWRTLWVRRFRKARRVAITILAIPRSLFFAFFAAAVLTVLADLLVRFVVRPAAARWLAPGSGTGASSLAFRLEAGETIAAECPARRASGRSWRPGTLARTGHRIWFVPIRWDVEPWSLEIERVQAVRVEPAPRFWWGLVLGMPDRISLVDRDGAATRFAVAEPTAVLDWFRAAGVAEYQYPS